METKVRGRWARGAIWGLVGFAALAVLAVCGLVIYLPDLVFARVKAAALANNVELVTCGGFDFERDGLQITRVTLRQCEFQSTLPMRPSGTIEQLDVELKNEVPTRVSLAGADVKVEGEQRLFELQSELSGPGEFELVAARNRLSWYPKVNEPPRLQINNVSRLAPTDPWSGELVLGQDFKGRFVFGKELSLDLEHASNPKNTLRIRVDLARFQGTAKLDLDALPTTLLSGVLFHNLPPELLTVQLSGNAHFDLPFGLNPRQPKGHFKFTLQGLTFPVPQEVAGLVYDSSPEIEGTVSLNRTFTKMKVDNLVFTTGSLRMKGKANVERTGVDTHWRTNMRGPLPCDAIARAAAKIHLQGLPLGPELAKAAARISKQAIKGSVEILVAIDAQSTDVANAKVVKTIGVGCGLEPLPLASAAADLIKDLPGIGAPGGVEDVLKELPSLSDLPQFPTLPNFPKKKRAVEPQPTFENDD